MNYYGIIVAGGTGTRMGTTLPKQFLELRGLPILMHTMNAFAHLPIELKLILVLHPDFHDYWKELCLKHDFPLPHHLVSGGANRFESVKNGLTVIDETDGVVAVHDAVRPLVSPQLIVNLFNQAATQGNAIPGVQCRDSIRKLRGGSSMSVNREDYRLVQTPQCFAVSLLKEAYAQEYTNEFTDDASVVEAIGVFIQLTEGDHRNIKITYPEDLLFAEAMLDNC